MTDTIGMDSELNDEQKKPLKEIPVVQDEGVFQHSTGDVYNGFFEAKKKDRNVKMHGNGVYTTAEGDSYTGIWENDRLGANEEVVIGFKDGSRYEGHFKDWCYNSKGRYIYPDESTLLADFSDNCPIGKLTLVDPNGHVWLGQSELGYGWFEPVNHFFELLEKTREGYKRKRRTSRVNEEQVDT